MASPSARRICFAEIKGTAACQLDLVEELPPRQLVVAHSSHLPIPQAAKEFMSMLEKGAE